MPFLKKPANSARKRFLKRPTTPFIKTQNSISQGPEELKVQLRGIFH